MKTRIAAQLYSLSKEYELDPVATLRRLAGFGYDGVEFYSYQLPAEQLAKELDRLHLTACSSHVQFDSLVNNIEEEINNAKLLGIDTLICPLICLRDFTAQEILEYRIKLEEIAEKLSAAGLRFGYHNHWMEMRKHGDAFVFDLLAEGNKNFCKEFDVFWSMAAGVDALAFMKENGDNIPFLHMKDYVIGPRKTAGPDSPIVAILEELKPGVSISQVPVGDGECNCEGLIRQAAEGAVEWIVVEQDFFLDEPFSCMDRSYKKIRSVLDRIETNGIR